MRLLSRLLAKWRRRPFYVVIYDEEIEPGSDEWTEEYYGYFSSSAEAWEMFNDFRRPNTAYQNVKLCQIMETWS